MRAFPISVLRLRAARAVRFFLGSGMYLGLAGLIAFGQTGDAFATTAPAKTQPSHHAKHKSPSTSPSMDKKWWNNPAQSHAPAPVASNTCVPAALTACAQEANAAIAQRGSGAADEVTTAIFASASYRSGTDRDTGVCLAQVALTLAPTDMAAATSIARLVANEGTSTMGSAFAGAVAAGCGSSVLADTATSPPSVTWRIRAVSELPPGRPLPPPCLNPSCT